MLTLKCWSVLFLAKPHHLRGTFHFITIYKAIQYCLQKALKGRNKQYANSRVRFNKKNFSHLIFLFHLFLKCLVAFFLNEKFVTFKFQYAVHNVAFAFPFEYVFLLGFQAQE